MILLLGFIKAEAQDGMLELNTIGAVSEHTFQKTVGGGGLGMAVYSNELDIVKKKEGQKTSLFAVRYGGDMMFAIMGDKTFRHVPLENPESGNAKVDFLNDMYSISTGLRFTTSGFSGRLIPYLDVLAGYRVFSSSMTIYPDDKAKQSTSQQLGSVKGISTSVGAGLIVDLTHDDQVMLNVGLALNHSETPGTYVDLSHIDRAGNSLDYYSRPSVEDYVIFKVGLTAMLDFKAHSPGEGAGPRTGSHTCFHSSGHCGGGHSSVSVHAR